jgi:hypothetical protein
MFGLKELPRLRPHVPPIGSKQVARSGNGSESSGDLDLESIGGGAHNFERRPEPSRGAYLIIAEVGVGQLLQSVSGQRMHPGAEAGQHLLRGHRIAGLQAINPDHARADPRPRRFAALVVVGGQAGMTLGGGVEGRHLPGQVVVPRAGGELVDTHGHSHPKGDMAPVGGLETQPRNSACKGVFDSRP